MIKLITGKKGTGKTKILVDMINNAVKDTNGDLICIEKGAKLTYDISYKVRLVDSDRFAIEGYEAFYGFIAGMFAGNYDIKEMLNILNKKSGVLGISGGLDSTLALLVAVRALDLLGLSLIHI